VLLGAVCCSLFRSTSLAFAAESRDEQAAEMELLSEEDLFIAEEQIFTLMWKEKD